jgi:hypothetical protein
VRIALSDAQVAQVVRASARRAGCSALRARLSGPQKPRGALVGLMDGPRYARSFLLGLLVLSAFPADGGERELSEVAREFTFAKSTTHRYLSTWLAVGVLEQDSRSRRYRRALSDTGAAYGGVALGGGDGS